MKPNPKWEESLEPQITQAREELRGRDPRIVSELSGAEFVECQPGQGELRLRMFRRNYTISWPELTVKDPQGMNCSNPIQAALLQYLVLSDGMTLAERWVSLRELPNGAFYERAFQGYSGNLVARAFKDKMQAFSETALKMGGEPLSVGDAAFRFWALPKIPLAVVYWSGGEEFPPSVQVLFDASAAHYHHLEMLAHLGSMICGRLIETYQSQNAQRD
jgi:hypothetical protein